MAKKIILPLLIVFGGYFTISAQERSKVIRELDNGCLSYFADELGNYLPDYSYAGYHYGEKQLPIVPVVATIAPVEGDNTSHLQNALDQVAALPLDSNGHRGALLLEAGVYRIDGSVTIGASGVVLRGSGQGTDTLQNTLITAPGTSTRTVIQMGFAARSSDGWKRRIPGTTTVVTNPFLPAGSRTLQVADPELYQVGDRVAITHPSTDTWLATIDYGATDTDDPWTPGTINMIYSRVIRGINLEEKKIIMDVPIFDHFELALAQAEVYAYDPSGISTEIGVENLRIDIQTSGEQSEDHAWNAIQMQGVEDCWVKDVTALHFTYAGVDVQRGNRVTVASCTAIEPHSEITGARRYNFAVGRQANNVLFRECHASEGRHTFVSNGASEVAGIVFYNSTSTQDYSTTEGHRRWSQGLLFDNLTFTDSRTSRVVGLYNRGRAGTGHGWAATNSTLWNVSVPLNRDILVQAPPLRQNYAFGCKAGFFNRNPPFGPFPAGIIEFRNQPPPFPSLYAAQFELRTSRPLSPDAPARLTATLENNQVKLEWLDIDAGEQGYQIEYQTSPTEDYQALVTLEANVTSYLHTDLDTASSLTYRVSALGEDCQSPYANPVTVPLTTSVRDPQVRPLRLFPNPANDKLFVPAIADLRELKAFSITGAKISINADQNGEIDLRHLPPGVYLLWGEDTQGNTLVERFIKQ